MHVRGCKLLAGVLKERHILLLRLLTIHKNRVTFVVIGVFFLRLTYKLILFYLLVGENGKSLAHSDFVLL